MRQEYEANETILEKSETAMMKGEYMKNMDCRKMEIA